MSTVCGSGLVVASASNRGLGAEKVTAGSRSKLAAHEWFTNDGEWLMMVSGYGEWFLLTNS